MEILGAELRSLAAAPAAPMMLDLQERRDGF